MNGFNRAFIQNFVAVAVLSTVGAGVAMAVASQDSHPAHSDSAGAAVKDTDITAKVKIKLAGVHGLNSSSVHVSTTNGVVTLTGTVDNSDQKDQVDAATKSVSGVRNVDDELTTASDSRTAADAKATAGDVKHAVSDTWITTKVKSELLADNVTKGYDVKVTTDRGVVILSGHLPNKDAIAHAKDVAEKVNGVKSVDTNGLTIGPS